MDIKNIRLRGTGFGVRLKHFPDNFIDAIIHSMKNEKDPYVTLVGYAYMVCGLKINDIRDLFILSDRKKTRKASREYIRQRVVIFYQSVYRSFKELYGDIDISLIHWEEETSYTYSDEGLPIEIAYKESELDEENSDDEESDKNTTPGESTS